MAELGDYFKLKRQDFLQSFQNCSIKASKEDIHNLRVSIKKIRAILAFLSYAEGLKNSGNYLKSLKPLFKRAGEIREFQMHEEILNSSLKIYRKTEIRNSIEDFKRSSSTRFIKQLSEFEFDFYLYHEKDIWKNINSIDEKKFNSLSRAFINEKLGLIHKIANESFDSSLHRIRKEVKIITEILKLRNVIQPDEKEEKLSVDIKSLSDHIGDWHDYDVFLKWLKKTDVSEGIDKEEINSQIRFLIEKEKEVIRRGIKEKLPTRLKRHSERENSK